MVAKKKTVDQPECCSGTSLQGRFDCHRGRAGADTVAKRHQGESRNPCRRQIGFDDLGKNGKVCCFMLIKAQRTGGDGEGSAGAAGEGNILNSLI